MKPCIICGAIKPLDEFYKHSEENTMCYTGQCPYEVYDGSCNRPPWKPCFLDEEIDKQIYLNLKTQGFEIGYTCPPNFDEIEANINFGGERDYSLPPKWDEDGV